jgi:hypothetical protein
LKQGSKATSKNAAAAIIITGNSLVRQHLKLAAAVHLKMKMTSLPF